MPTSVYYSGKQIYTPGVYSTVDASQLNSVNVQASGIVALIGSSQGGMPYTAITDRSKFPVFSSPQQVKANYPAGDLLEAANLCFGPSNDPAIRGGAKLVVCLKVDPATQATATFSNPQGPVFTATSRQYGTGANAVNLAITAGTTQGKLITISNGQVVESKDNLGGAAFGSILYTGSQTMQGQFDASGNFTAQASFTQTGLQNDIPSNSSLAGTQSTITAQANAADNGKILTVIGVTSGGAVFADTLVLQTGVAVATSHSFASIAALVLNTASADAIAIRAPSNAAINFSLPAGTTTRGSIAGFPVAAGKLTFTCSAVSTTPYIVVEGINASGVPVVEVVAQSTTAVQTANSFTRITRLDLGPVANGTTVTVAYQAANYAASANSSVADLAAYLAGTGTGITVSLSDSNQSSTQLATLDKPATATSLNSGLSLSASAAAIVNWVNNNSALLTLTQAPGATGQPSNTTSPVYLTGGTQTPATFADWQNCLNLLQTIRVNTVVPLTCNQAVAIAATAHCAYMCGLGQSERDCVVGALNPAGTGYATKAQIAQQTLALNARHTRLVPQGTMQYNTQGQQVTMPPQFRAAMVAGMQAGAGVGQSLTNKTSNELGVVQDPSWNPLIDSDALIQTGALIFVQRDNIGIQCVRNVTTWQKDNNVAYCEASVNQAADFAVYNFRYELIQYVGQSNFAGTLNAIYAGAVKILLELKAQGIITGFQNPVVTPDGDKVLVAVSIAPVQPTNFILANVSLVQNITGN